MIGITFDYDIVLDDRNYEIGETVTHGTKKYRVREIGKCFIIYLVPKEYEM